MLILSYEMGRNETKRCLKNRTAVESVTGYYFSLLLISLELKFIVTFCYADVTLNDCANNPRKIVVRRVRIDLKTIGSYGILNLYY